MMLGKVLSRTLSYLALMSHKGLLLFSLSIFVCLLMTASPPARSDVLAGRVAITTDYQLYGVGGLDGGGHITWDVYSDQASHLREKIVNMFDDYTNIPPGFPCEGMATKTTSGAPNGIIDDDEGSSYSDRLENWMEQSCDGMGSMGITDRYMTIKAADRSENQLRIERSTDGLVGSTANTSTKLEIRFIFNPNPINIGSTRFNLAENSLPDALHKVFDLDLRSYVYTSPSGLNSIRPMQSTNGWHVAWTQGDTPAAVLPVLTTSYAVNPVPGNASESYWGYASNAANVSEIWPAYYLEPGRGNVTNVDLRFADNAYLAMDYMGSRSQGADRLKLQIATPPSYANWVDVPDENGTAWLNNTTWLDWTKAVFPLNSYLNQTVRLRLNFTTAPSVVQGSPGFFIRSLEIRGESRYHGWVDYGSTSYVVSTTSYSNFDISKGSANMIRTPAGDILFYGIGYNTEDRFPPDSIRYDSFDFFENPQITFGLTVAAAYLIAYYQNRYFMQFKSAHPLQYRPAAGKIKWLHWLGRILIILMIFFYFFPGMFAFVAPGFLIGGPAMWFLGVFFVVGIALLSKFMYMRQATYIPPETFAGAQVIPAVGVIPPPPDMVEAPPQVCAECLNPIEKPGDAYKCECGKVYHKKCAAELKECPECHRKIDIKTPVEKVMTVQCPTCREVQQVKEGADLNRTKCAKCDTVLRAIDEGMNYLVIDKDPGTSYAWFVGLVRRERPALCMTTGFPEKAKKEYSLEGVDMYWLSDTNPGPKTLDPKRLDFEVIRAISAFAKERKGGAIILDGLEYLVVENGFDKTFKFVKRVNDVCSVNETTFLVPISPGALGPDELTMLRKEFDRVEELVAPPPPPKPRKK